MLKLFAEGMRLALSKWCVLSHNVLLLSAKWAHEPAGSLATGQGTRPVADRIMLRIWLGSDYPSVLIDLYWRRRTTCTVEYPR